jgi:hypothetical protein
VGVMESIAKRAARTEFARRALADGADLSLFRERPSPRIITGLVVIGFSYLIGWPAVALFGVLSIAFREPLLVIVGGPAIYGFSHLLFWVGFYLTGAPYAHAFLKWATRKFLMRFLPGEGMMHAGGDTGEE